MTVYYMIYDINNIQYKHCNNNMFLKKKSKTIPGEGCLDVII